ncbi:MAG: hypothetical protein MK116_10375 [Phycisphaerales bacterium]|nr:hypothetical protein [Phycisphaerales bacterium]
MNSIAAVLSAGLIVSLVATGAGGGVPVEPTVCVESIHRVLDQPRIQSVFTNEDSIMLDLEWPSRWRGGSVEVPGSLFLEHATNPAGCVVACRVDPAVLADQGRWSLVIPVDANDPAMVMLQEAALQDLRVRFSPRPGSR